MDPFSVSTACIGLVAAVAQLSVQIKGFISQTRDAPAEWRAVITELDSLSFGLHNVGECSKFVELSEAYRSQFVTTAQNCHEVVEEMKLLLDKLSSGGFFKRAEWALSGRDKMLSLKASLEAHKSAVILAVTTTHLYVRPPLHVLRSTASETFLLFPPEHYTERRKLLT